MGARILAYHFGLFVLNSSLLTNIQFSSLFKVFGRLTTIYCESHKIPEILIQISLCKGQSELDQSECIKVWHGLGLPGEEMSFVKKGRWIKTLIYTRIT